MLDAVHHVLVAAHNGVADIPAHYDAAIYSSDLLLRQAEYLTERSEDLHQQIRIGEMEAAGFGTACNQRATPIPWFIVRGVSEFRRFSRMIYFSACVAPARAEIATPEQLWRSCGREVGLR